MAVRILHIADVHLDRPFVGVAAERRRQLRRRLLDTFARALEVAVERRCDLVTVGGDLWEEENVTRSTRREVAALLARAGLPVAIVAGNHDPIVPGGNWQRTELPANVHLFGAGELECWRPLAGSAAPTIWGISWGGGQLSADFLARPLEQRGAGTALLLLHGTAGDVAAGDLGDRHCPFEPDAVRRAGFELCLCGHIHKPQVVESGGRPAVVYPGSPFPLAFDEAHDHGALLVTIDGPGVEIERVPLGAPPCMRVVVDCAGAESALALRERFEAALAEAGVKADGVEGGFLTVELVGAVAPTLGHDLDEVLAPLAVRFDALRVVDHTRRAYDLDAIARLPTARGRFVRALRERIAHSAGRERKVAELALEAGLRALDGDEPL